MATVGQRTDVGSGVGILLMVGLGLVYLGVALWTHRQKITDAHSFVIADRRIGFGMGVASIIAVWTWANAVVTSSAVTFDFGVSGMWWFVATNGITLMLLIPFGRRLRNLMPRGYTIAEFAKVRFGDRKNHYIFVASMLFGGVVAGIINLKGLELVITTIFGLESRTVVLIGGTTVLLYAVFGGMWTTATTGTIQTFMITLPAVLVIPLAINAVGGVGAIGNHLNALPANYRNPFDSVGAIQFGILFMMGNFAFSLADQPYWQKVWSIKRRWLEPSLFWAGAWYWPIPFSLAILGLIGLTMGADVAADLGGDSGRIGPFVVANLGLPLIAVLAYSLVIIAACYSSMDGGFSAIASIMAVDIAGTYAPDMSHRRLFLLTKASMVTSAAISMLVVLSGVNLVPLVLILFALKTSVLFPLVLAILWRRLTSFGSFIGIVAGILIGMPVYIWVDPWWGAWLVMGLSLVVPIIVSLFQKTEFDFAKLSLGEEALKRKALISEQVAAEPLSG